MSGEITPPLRTVRKSKVGFPVCMQKFLNWKEVLDTTAMLQQFFIILAVSSAVFMLGFMLSLTSKKFRVESKDPTADLINNHLPQVQCGQCGFVGCSEYAAAVAAGKAPINLCTPGGDAVIRKIAEIMQVPVTSAFGMEQEDRVARISSESCIGCGKCAKICPYDAIEGVLKQPYHVNPAFCMSCNKCVDTCPKKCIAMVVPDPTTDTWDWVIENTGEAR